MRADDQKSGRQREGGGAPADRDREEQHAGPNAADAGGAGPIGSEASVVNRRDLPGGSYRPARTPGALGPTTRDVD